jgi:hypothetical protein
MGCGKKKPRDNPAYPAPVRAEASPNLEERLRTAILYHVEPGPLDGKRRTLVAALIRELGSDDFDTREGASAGLSCFGAGVLPELAKAAKHHDPEVAERAKAVARYIRSGRSESALVTKLLETQMQSLAVIDAIHLEREAMLRGEGGRRPRRAERKALARTIETLVRIRRRVDKPDYLGMAREHFRDGRFDETEQMLQAFIDSPGREPEVRKRARKAISYVRMEKDFGATRRKMVKAAARSRRTSRSPEMAHGSLWKMMRLMHFDNILGTKSRRGTKGNMLKTHR